MPIGEDVKWGEWSTDGDVKREDGFSEDLRSPYTL